MLEQKCFMTPRPRPIWLQTCSLFHRSPMTPYGGISAYTRRTKNAEWPKIMSAGQGLVVVSQAMRLPLPIYKKPTGERLQFPLKDRPGGRRKFHPLPIRHRKSVTRDSEAGMNVMIPLHIVSLFFAIVVTPWLISRLLLARQSCLITLAGWGRHDRLNVTVPSRPG